MKNNIPGTQKSYPRVPYGLCIGLMRRIISALPSPTHIEKKWGWDVYLPSLQYRFGDTPPPEIPAGTTE